MGRWIVYLLPLFYRAVYFIGSDNPNWPTIVGAIVGSCCSTIGIIIAALVLKKCCGIGKHSFKCYIQKCALNISDCKLIMKIALMTQMVGYQSFKLGKYYRLTPRVYKFKD